MVSASIAKQNFSTESEDVINRQIQIDQIAQQQYLSTAAYFGRDDIALPVTFYIALASHIRLLIFPLGIGKALFGAS